MIAERHFHHCLLLHQHETQYYDPSSHSLTAPACDMAPLSIDMCTRAFLK